MKLVIHAPVEAERLQRITAAAAPMQVVNAASAEEAAAALTHAEAFFGKIMPPLLAGTSRLRWVQAPTASLEHYLFPELVDHPCAASRCAMWWIRGAGSDCERFVSRIYAATDHFCTNRHADLEFSMTRRLFQPINHGRHCHVGDADDPR